MTNTESTSLEARTSADTAAGWLPWMASAQPSRRVGVIAPVAALGVAAGIITRVSVKEITPGHQAEDSAAPSGAPR